MRLLRVRLRNVGPFEDVALTLGDEVTDDDGITTATTRPLTVLFGGDGTGKTSLLSALALTRPGYALPPLPGAREGRRAEPESTWNAAEWILGDDDPSRPHPLLVTSPSAVLTGESAETAAARRREQALFDRRAQGEGGFVFVSFSGARWFSRAPNMLTTPDRSILRYDVRQPASFDDPTRADLARETKQILAYAAVGSALGRGRAEHARLVQLDTALHEVLDIALAPFGYTYAGVSPVTLEPEARDERGRVVAFDALPRAAKHLTAFVALPLRALAAAYAGAETPREREGVVVIDDAEAQQDPALLRALPGILRGALPNVQWLLATASTQLAIACASSEVIALRRTSEARVELGTGMFH